MSKRSVSEAITVGLIFTKVSQAEIDNLKSGLIGRLKIGNIFADAPRVAQGLINRLNKYQQYYPIVGLDNLENLNVLFPKRELNFPSYRMEESAAIIINLLILKPLPSGWGYRIG